ncbi:MAG: hypothetical protein HC796_02170 [Synechococcaceae cyanobacterium RL_1_2]|nr:hypothetical protein [Synechococcaceae cyanobacterium RL_1_2]
MKSWLNQGLKVLIYGIDTEEGSDACRQITTYGAQVVAGIIHGGNPLELEWLTGLDIPSFYLVEQAIAAVPAIDLAMIFVDSYRVSDAVQESIYGGIKHILIITGNIPPQDMINLKQLAQNHGAHLLGGEFRDS